MSDVTQVVGRAGFHATHTKAVAERAAVLHEMMRELDPDAVAYWAGRNASIVVADEPLNEAMVNDGEGAFAKCSDRRQVIEYGDARLRRVGRKLKEDRVDLKTGKTSGGTVTTTMIVMHLPKSMCVEEPGFYPVLDKQTGKERMDPATGQPLRRSRWVARDRDEARRYFEDCIAYLGENVIPGGMDAILGYDIQHSESTPHVQVLADAFADDPKKPGQLKASASEAWFSHRSVTDEKGKIKSGPAKMRDYHAGLKAYLIAKGYDISPDYDEERHLTGLGKQEYEASQDKLREAKALEADLPRRRAAARQQGHSEGRQQGLAEAQPMVTEAAQRLAAARSAQAAAEGDRVAASAAREQAEEVQARAELVAQEKAARIIAAARARAEEIEREAALMRERQALAVRRAEAYADKLDAQPLPAGVNSVILAKLAAREVVNVGRQSHEGRTLSSLAWTGIHDEAVGPAARAVAKALEVPPQRRHAAEQVRETAARLKPSQEAEQTSRRTSSEGPAFGR